MNFNRQFQIQTPIYYQNQQVNQITPASKRPNVQQQPANVLRQQQYNQQYQCYQPNIQQINQQKQQNIIQPPVQQPQKQIPPKNQTPIAINPTKNNQIPSNQQKQINSNIKKLDTYEIFLNKVLGEGQFGIVYLACNKDENNQLKYYAVKMISIKSLNKLEKIQKQMLIREIDLLNKAKHDNLISLHEMKTTQNNIYLFLDYCNGGNLRQFLTKNKGRLAEDQAMQFFIQLCAGYKQLYQQNIVHRDLKPENILLNDGKVKIGDYGFGKIIDGDMNAQMKLTKLGTPLYASPQVLLGNPYSSKTDIWSTGVILFEMLYGQKPFHGNNELALIRDMEAKTKGKIFLCPNKILVSPQIQDLISRMLRFYEEDRISWEDLFSHQVINNNQSALFNQNAGDYEEEEADLYKSIVENRQTIQKNIVIDHPTVNNINSVQSNQEDEEENNYQLFKKEQEIRYNAQQTHQLFLLIRNKALFSNVTLQWFWEFSQKLDASRILCKAIVFCCGGYYYYSILELKNIFQNLIKQNYVSEENFQIYKMQKLYFEQAYMHIQNDFIQAENFFVPFRKYVYNELSKQIARYRQQTNYDQELARYLDEFINFVYQQSQSPMAYTQATQNLLKKILQQIKINDLGFHQMKTIYAVQIFSQIDKFLPLKNFLQIDLRKFYDQNLVNIQLEELKNNVIQQNSLLLHSKDNNFIRIY